VKDVKLLGHKGSKQANNSSTSVNGLIIKWGLRVEDATVWQT